MSDTLVSRRLFANIPLFIPISAPPTRSMFGLVPAATIISSAFNCCPPARSTPVPD